MAPGRRKKSASKVTPKKRNNPPASSHLPGHKFEQDQESYIVELKEGHALNWGIVTTKFNTRFPQVARSKGALQVHYSRSLKPGELRRPPDAPANVPPEELHAQEQVTSDRVNTLAKGSNAIAIKDEKLVVDKEENSDDTEVANPGSRFTVSKLASKTIISLGRKPKPTEQTRHTEKGPAGRKNDSDSLFMKEVEQIVGKGRKRTRNVSYADNEASGDDTEEEEGPANKKLVTSSGVGSNAKVTRKAGGWEGSVAKDSVPANDFQNQSKVIGASKVGSASLTNAKQKSSETETVKNFSAGYKKRLGPPSQSSEQLHAPQPSTFNTHLQLTEQSTEQSLLGLGKQGFSNSQEMPSNTSGDWEMCIPGHKEWELQRENNPRMPDSTRNPKNRVVEYNVKNGSFRLRKRREGDPPAHLMEPRYVPTPPRLPVPVTPSLPTNFPYGSYPKQMSG